MVVVTERRPVINMQGPSQEFLTGGIFQYPEFSSLQGENQDFLGEIFQQLEFFYLVTFCLFRRFACLRLRFGFYDLVCDSVAIWFCRFACLRLRVEISNMFPLNMASKYVKPGNRRNLEIAQRESRPNRILKCKFGQPLTFLHNVLVLAPQPLV